MSRDFWSRRRARVAEEEAEIAARDARESVANEDAAREAEQAGKTDEELLAELGLPDPDTLSAGDDFQAFMARAVPDHLRRRALRRLWRSNPVLACVDGLNDYDADYTGGGVAKGTLQTAYRVGTGYLQKLAEFPETPDETQEEAVAEPAEPLEDKETLAAAPADGAEMETRHSGQTRRRMRFAFDADPGEQDKG